MPLLGVPGLHRQAGLLQARTGRLGRAQRVFLLLPSVEAASPSLLAGQVRSPVRFCCCSILLSCLAAVAFASYYLTEFMLTFSHRRLCLAFGLDFQLRIRFCSFQLADSDNRRTRSFRCLGSWWQQLRLRWTRWTWWLEGRQRCRSLRLRRSRQRLGSLVFQDFGRLDCRPLDQLVGRQRMPRQHLVRLD